MHLKTNEMCPERNKMGGGDLLSSGTATLNILLEAAVGASSSTSSCDVEATLQKAES